MLKRVSVPDSVTRQINFRRYDLNVLPFLRTLLLTHSVARSSEILGVSQSAVSGALKRLRETFGDPLFVQVGRNLVPTPKALQLQSLIEDSFSALACLFEERQFVAEEEERCFIICTSDYVTAELATPLLKLLRSRAPRCSLRFVELSKAELKEVELGNIDVQISPKTCAVPSEDLMSLALWEDEQVILCPQHLQLPPSGIEKEVYFQMDHATFFVNGADSLERHALNALNLEKRTVIFVPEHSQLPRLVRDTGCLAMVPKSAALRYAREYGLQISPVPFALPRYTQSIFWSAILDQDPAHKWFRELIQEAWPKHATRDLTKQAAFNS